MWQLLVGCRIAVAYAIFPALIKKITAVPGRLTKLTWQFFLAGAFSWLLWMASPRQDFIGHWPIIVLLGAVNSFAAYCQWRAIAVSLSKTALFTQADDLIAIVLGMAVLGEACLFNFSLILGIIFCFSAVALLALAKRSIVVEAGKSNLPLFGWIAGYSFIWGLAVFAMRYFALSKVEFPQFAVLWYGGSWLGSWVMLLAGKLLGGRFPSIKQEVGLPLSSRQFSGVAVLSAVIWLAMLLNYKAFELAPIAVVQPIFMVSEAVLPALIGLFIFAERKQLNRQEWLSLIVGLAGIILLARAY